MTTALATRTEPTPSLTEVAVDTIRDRILDLTLAPGSRIDEKLLMQQFGLSRTPAREALNRLAAEGLVEIQPNRGAYVRPLSLAHFKQFFDAYHAAERLIAFYCNFADPGLVEDMEKIQRRHSAAVAEDRFLEVTATNAAFHLRIAAATANDYIHDFSARLHNQGRRLAYLVYQTEAQETPVLRRQQSRIIAEHEAVIDAIRDQDRERLIEVITDHAKRFQQRIARFVEHSRGSEFPLA